MGAGRQTHIVSPFRSLKEMGDWINAGGRDPHDEVNMIEWGKPAGAEEILELCREIERDTGEGVVARSSRPGRPGAGHARPAALYVSEEQPPELQPDELLGAFARHEVRFVAVGGFAALQHGATRPTNDLDVCPARDRENLARLADVLTVRGERTVQAPGSRARRAANARTRPDRRPR